MVATQTLWATGTPTTAHSGAGAWTNAANAAGTNNAGFATFTSVTSAETGTITCTGYAADATLGMQIPVSIDSVVATVYFNVATVLRWTSVTAQLMDGATPLGSASAMTLTTTSANSQAMTFTGVAAWANMAALGVRIVATKSGTTSDTANVDAVGVVVNYTPSTVTGHNASSSSNVLMVG